MNKAFDMILAGIQDNTPDVQRITKEVQELAKRSSKLRDRLKAMQQSPAASDVDSEFIRKREEQIERLKKELQNG